MLALSGGLSFDRRIRLEFRRDVLNKLRAHATQGMRLEHQPQVRLLAALNLALGRRGFRVCTADGPGEAFELIQREPTIELIVLDVMMPGMDGVTALRLLRNSTSAPVLM